jgi:BON domain
MRASAVAAAAALLLSAATGQAQDAAERLLNPFGDPFLPATRGRACPAPLGPAYTETERRVEAHSRAERGTTCWLAGLCAEPNAYRYDAANAAAAVAALQADPALADSALWVTAQRRFVYLEGCVADVAQAARAEAVVKALGDVERVIPALALPGERAPYAVAPAARGPLSPASDAARTR